VECLSDPDCADPTPRCDPVTGGCVHCILQSDCPDGTACDPTTLTCVVP
jgi:hypothetical protein